VARGELRLDVGDRDDSRPDPTEDREATAGLAPLVDGSRVLGVARLAENGLQFVAVGCRDGSRVGLEEFPRLVEEPPRHSRVAVAARDRSEGKEAAAALAVELRNEEAYHSAKGRVAERLALLAARLARALLWRLDANDSEPTGELRDLLRVASARSERLVRDGRLEELRYEETLSVRLPSEEGKLFPPSIFKVIAGEDTETPPDLEPVASPSLALGAWAACIESLLGPNGDCGDLRRIPGVDPVSGLPEYYLPSSRDKWREPIRGADGRITVEQDTPVIIVPLPGGRYWMGTPECEELERVRWKCGSGESDETWHEVEIDPFLIAKHPLTQSQSNRLSRRKNPSVFRGAVLPVSGVSWKVARNLCRELGLRLPTEAEWEYACRAPEPEAAKDEKAAVREIHAENKQLEDRAWFAVNSRMRPHRVGWKLPNRFGLHDLQGSVWE
jgi:hypothetical protein